MNQGSFTMTMPVDGTGRPLKTIPPGLPTALDAFKHAKTLAEMAQMWGKDDMMIESGFNLVVSKLKTAARSTEAAKHVGPTFYVGRSPIIPGDCPAKVDTKALFGDTEEEDTTAATQLCEFRALADFWSWNLKETTDIPELDDAEGWVKMMKRPGCQWDTLWAAYCVAQIEAM